jgi:hypothetical protein
MLGHLFEEVQQLSLLVLLLHAAFLGLAVELDEGHNLLLDFCPGKSIIFPVFKAPASVLLKVS